MSKFVGCEGLILTENLNIDPRLIGGEATLNPFAANNSSQRMNMNSSMTPQAVIVDGCEPPFISSGYETQFSKYTQNPTRLKQSGTVIATIPKYRTNIGTNPIKQCNSAIVIYRGEDDGKVNYFELDKYTKGAEGFGWENNILNPAILSAGRYIDKDMLVSTSPAVEGNLYKLGVNAYTACMSRKETAEDAVFISESLANKLSSTAIYTTKLYISPAQIPINHYGDDVFHKMMPDIGEQIGDDGILCALRPTNELSMITDARPAALNKIQQYDEVTYGKAGATIIDISAYINHSRKIKTSSHIFAQPFNYWNNLKTFYEGIYEVYQNCQKERFSLSSEFISLAEYAMQMLRGYGKHLNGISTTGKSPKFTLKKEPIEFMYLEITYMYKKHIQPGDKLTGRDAGKGVVFKVYADDDMPVDGYGHKADIVRSTEAIVNRMIAGQSIEQALNFVGSIVTKQAKQMAETDINAAYNHILEFITDVNPKYAQIVTTEISKIKNGVEKYLDEIFSMEGIVITCPPSLDTLKPGLFLYLRDKYKAYPTPVKFNLRDNKGNLLRSVTTKKPIMIGVNYMMLLCKTPKTRSAGVSHINQLGIPVKPHNQAKQNFPINILPLRFGEDEQRQMIMAAGADVTARIFSLYSSSMLGVERTFDTLLTADVPSAVDMIPISNEELTASNSMIAVARHMLSNVGIDLQNTNINTVESTLQRSIDYYKNKRDQQGVINASQV